MAPGTILDPITASVSGTDGPDSGGGCDTGAGVGFALAALAFAAFPKRRRG
jgi:Synergist-CTERM protein sorting domain-containing protein